MPQKVTADVSQLELGIGDQIPIQVLGTYGDGSIVDLSKSKQTTYAAQNTGIATVTSEGLITGLAPGYSRSRALRIRDK